MARLSTLLPIRLEMQFEVEADEAGEVRHVYLAGHDVTSAVLADNNAWVECTCAAADRVEVVIPEYANVRWMQ
jgi:hypothetical protein